MPEANHSASTLSFHQLWEATWLSQIRKSSPGLNIACQWPLILWFSRSIFYSAGTIRWQWGNGQCRVRFQWRGRPATVQYIPGSGMKGSSLDDTKGAYIHILNLWCEIMRNDSSVNQAAKVHAWLVLRLIWRGHETLITMILPRLRLLLPEILRGRTFGSTPRTCHSSFTAPIWIDCPLPTSHIFMASPFPCRNFVLSDMQNGRPRKKWCYSPSSALTALLIWMIAITSSPGGITVARDASYTSHPGDVLF